MKSNIQIKFLTIPEMADAKNIDYRYEHVGIDNLGFADKLKNRIYVRAGLDSELSKLLIDHELSHLFELEGTDEDEHGIRHKKKGGFMSVFAPIAMAILGSILVPGVGGLLGGGLGSVLGGATGVGLGAGLGGTAGSSMVGKPNWLGNTIGGAAAGLGSGLGSLAGGIGGTTGGSGIGGATGGSGVFSEVLGNGLSQGVNSQLAGAGSLMGGTAGSGIGSSIGSSIGSGIGSLFTGALGSGQSAQGGYGPTSGGQSFRMPDLSQNSNTNPSFSGWSNSIGMPTMGSNYGMSGAMGPSGLGTGTQGGGLGIRNPGLGQAGIALGGAQSTQSTPQTSQAGQGFNAMFNPQMDEYGFNQMNGGQLSF